MSDDDSTMSACSKHFYENNKKHYGFKLLTTDLNKKEKRYLEFPIIGSKLL